MPQRNVAHIRDFLVLTHCNYFSDHRPLFTEYYVGITAVKRSHSRIEGVSAGQSTVTTAQERFFSRHQELLVLARQGVQSVEQLAALVDAA